MKIGALGKDLPDKKIEAFATHLKTEALKVHELIKENVLRENYFRQEESGAVLILECSSLETAQEKLGELPLVKNNLIEFE